MPKMICVKCQTFYHVKKNGVVALEQMPVETAAEPGTIDPTAWKPYKIWHADLWECRECGHEVISGFGANPVAEHYQENFAGFMPHVTHTVNDCC